MTRIQVACLLLDYSYTATTYSTKYESEDFRLYRITKKDNSKILFDRKN